VESNVFLGAKYLMRLKLLLLVGQH